MEKIDKEEIEFDEKIKKLEERIDKKSFEKIEEWLEKKEMFLNKKYRILLFIRKKPFVLIFLILFFLSFLLPSPFILYVAPITTILIILAIFSWCPPLNQPPILEEWLAQHPRVRGVIYWEFGGDRFGGKNYLYWEISFKSFLQRAFEHAWYFGDVWWGLTIIDPPPNRFILEDDEEAVICIDENHAFSLYISYISHCLAIEIKEKVPWSLLEYTREGLEILLDGREMFKGIGGRHFSINRRDHGEALPAPPDFTFSFFRQNNLIESSRGETIVRIINWCRDNLVHFSGYFTAQNMEAHWQYRGNPPVSRIINGTISEYNPEWGLRHYSAGCWGTLGFLRSILRAVNIPVKVKSHSNHAQVCFISERLYLCHGDDPYNQLSKVTPLPTEESQLYPGESLLPPAKEMLISQQLYNEWYVERDESVSRRVKELAVIYLPDYLLYWDCKDKVARRSHEDSVVYDSLKKIFSVEYLEEQRLWQRLRDKIAAWGGCDLLPNAHEI